jgi:lipopolysaccharide export system permease protein
MFPTMRLLPRYLLRTLAAPFVFSVAALTGMLMINHLAKRLGDLIGKGLEPAVIAEVLLLSLPFIVALTLPMAVLVAVLYGFSHLTADNEITAMRASGVSVAQMLRPVLVAGVAVALFNFVFIDQVLPRSNARLKTLQSDIGRKKPTFLMREQVVNPMPPTNYHLRAGRIEPVSGRLRDVTIYDLSLPTVRRVVYADSGFMAFEDNERDLRVVLYRGEVHEYRADELDALRVTVFEVNTIRARNVSNTLERSAFVVDRGDREMTTCEMIDRVVHAQGLARRALRQREAYTTHDLRTVLRLTTQPPEPFTEPPMRRHCGPWRRVEDLLGRFLLPEPVEAQAAPATLPPTPVPPPAAPPQRALGPVLLSNPSAVSEALVRQAHEVRQANTFDVEVHKKFTISVACFNFVLIGIALALRFPRGGMGLVLGGSLVIFTLFYVTLTAGESLADRGIVPPWVAMWTPNLVIGVLGLLGLRAASRATGTARGGDLAELVEVLFGRLLGRRA